MRVQEKAKHWFIDYLYMVYGAIVSHFHLAPPKHYLEYVVAGKVPVIIIPGVFNRWSFMKKIADEISSEGHPVHVVSGLGYNLFSIPKSSDQVASIIEKEDVHNVVIVSHSKGGLIGKHVLVHHNSDNRILGMVSIATPYSGSEMAKLLPISPLNELRTGGDIISDLHLNTVVNSNIVSLIPEYDNHVWAVEGCYLEGAKNIQVKVHGHHKVLYDEHVITTVISSIDELSKKIQ